MVNSEDWSAWISALVNSGLILAEAFCSKFLAYSAFLSNANLIPKPNSALSSNNEFAHTGPQPSLLVVQGVVGKFPP